MEGRLGRNKKTGQEAKSKPKKEMNQNKKKDKECYS